MKHRFFLVFLFLLVFTCLYSREHSVKFEHISVKEGLSQSIIFCILRDSKGFMWFGTVDGLNRFDGYNVVIYKPDPGDPYSLSGRTVRSLLEDQNGVLWIGTDKGLNKYDRERDRFIRCPKKKDTHDGMDENPILAIYEDKAGTLWIGTGGSGLNQYDPKTGQFIHYITRPGESHSLRSNTVNSIYEDGKDILWIGTDDGLDKFDREAGQFSHYKNRPGDPHSLSSNTIRAICEDGKGTLWIGTDDGGLDKFERETGQFSHYKNRPGDPHSLISNTVRAICEDGKGMLWIGTEDGLEKFDRETERFVHYKNHPDNTYSLSNNTVISIYQDTQGLLWIGTVGGGVNIFDREKRKFIHYRTDPDDPNGLNHNMVLSIYEEPSGVLWIGTRGGGLNKFDPASGKFTHYIHRSNTPSGLSNNDVTAICQGVSGILWIGTRGGGLNKFNPVKETFIHYKKNPDHPSGLSDDIVLTIYQDSPGILWIGTREGGLNKFDPVKETFIHYKNKPGNSAGLSSNYVSSIHKDHAGILWIGTEGGGLNRFDEKKEIFTAYKNDTTNPNSLSHNEIICIYEDRYEVLWIGTRGGGLNKLEKDKKRWTTYTVNEGLPNNIVYGILEDNDGNLWLSTSKGISKFNPTIDTFNNYDVNDGLQADEFNTGALYKNPESGEMFFGGVNGFNRFYPKQIKDNTFRPPVVITAFKKFYRPVVFDKAISESEAIIIPQEDNNFSFEFAALNYSNREKNQYAYKLEGFEEKWNYCGTRRYAAYTNLGGGTYVFRVKGSNDAGYWNEKGASIKIIIIPPFWKTAWFMILVVVFIIAGIYLSYRVRVRFMKQRREELEQTVETRTIELNRKTRDLEKINLIVKAINMEMHFDEFLGAILEKTMVMKGMERSAVLVRDPKTGRFRFKTLSKIESERLEGIQMTEEEAEARYVKGSQRACEDIFIVKNVEQRPHGKKILPSVGVSKAMLVNRIRIENKTEAYLLFDNMNDENAFDNQDFLFLENLKEHIVTAFLKARVISQLNEAVDALEKKHQKLKEAQSQLAHSEKMAGLGTLVAGVAHEINNPTNFAHGSAFNLERDIWKLKTFLLELAGDDADEEVLAAFDEKFDVLFKHLDTLQEGTLRIKQIVKDLRTFSRLDEPDMKHVGLLEGLQTTYHLVRTNYSDHVEFVTDFRANPEIECYPAELNQVYMNLMMNACQAIIQKQKRTGDTGKGLLKIQTREEKGYAVIVFQDTGTGMSKDVQQKMFDPFFTTRGIGEGTGLGLSISFGILDKHGGRFEVDSEEGIGTAITLYLSLERDPASTAKKK